ncbi:MAG: Fe-S cluster assembly ATPase SufC [Candidatus Caenarcaniphilales bacterium]|nr:Fe-S cluster assembly ATPase SufC [Candidatus Caenarcaniphilales bacterium]
MQLLEIRNLKASINEEQILNGINLNINIGEIHAIMGPNGSGKSTLSKIIAGHPDYQDYSGEILLSGEQINELEPSERANKGIFLGFQYPVEVPGVNNAEFLRLALNSKRVYESKTEMEKEEFDILLNQKIQMLNMDEFFLERSVNDGFSGGEKKRNEILQMAILEPRLSILDEIDSGLDIDALKIVSEGINKVMNPNNGLLLITHYQRLLRYVKPTHVHIMYKGKIVKSGGEELAEQLERGGYESIKEIQPDSGVKV